MRTDARGDLAVTSDSSARERISQVLGEIAAGDPGARDALAPLVYDGLHDLAARMMRRERPGKTIQTTALVHDAFMRLVGEDHGWESRRHFFRAAAAAMRRILVGHARRRNVAKRGGDHQRVELHSALQIVEGGSEDVVALSDALDRFATVDERGHDVVMLRYFSGLSVEETARVLSVSDATVKREWAAARVWLYREMTAR